MAQMRFHLFAHAIERLLVEARRIDRQRQQSAGAVEMTCQRSHPSADLVGVGVEADLDGLFVERAVKALAVEIAGALVE